MSISMTITQLQTLIRGTNNFPHLEVFGLRLYMAAFFFRESALCFSCIGFPRFASNDIGTPMNKFFVILSCFLRLFMLANKVALASAILGFTAP